MAKLFQAIENGDTGQAWNLIKEGVALDEVDEATEMTALALAAESGSSEIVRMLLAAGAAPDLGGLTTPLEAAVVGGHVEIARALIEAAADVNRRVEEGFTPLMTAAATGNMLLVRVLLDAGARPRMSNDAGDTAVSLALGEGHEAIVGMLRAHRSRPSKVRKVAAPEERAVPEKAIEPKERTAPEDIQAPERANVSEPSDRVEEKSESESSIFEPSQAPPDAGVEAASDLFPFSDWIFSAAEEEISAGAGTSPLPPTGDSTTVAPGSNQPGRPETPIASDVESEAAEKTSGPEDPPPQDSELPDANPPTATPMNSRLAEKLVEFEKLIAEGALETLQQWIDDRQIAADDRDANGRTPLMIAAAHGEPETVRLFLAAGPELHLTDGTDSARSALVHAIRSSSPRRSETVELLVSAGADIDQPCGRNRRTPLMHAAENDVYMEDDGPLGFALTTKTLIRLGAQLEVTDRQGNTVWRLTKRNALGARTSSSYRRRLHQMLRVLEHAGAQPIASHMV